MSALPAQKNSPSLLLPLSLPAPHSIFPPSSLPPRFVALHISSLLLSTPGVAALYGPLSRWALAAIFPVSPPHSAPCTREGVPACTRAALPCPDLFLLSPPDTPPIACLPVHPLALQLPIPSLPHAPAVFLRFPLARSDTL